MELLVRKAKPKDAPGIAKVQVETWQNAYQGLIPDSYLNSLSIEKRTSGWKKQLENPKEGSYVFVAEFGDNIVGWCTAGFSLSKDTSKDTGEVYGIYVHPDYARRGAGSKLMEKALDTLKEDGFKKAILWVLTSNGKTRKWYESKGWRVEGKTTIDNRDGVKLHETRYIKDLN